MVVKLLMLSCPSILVPDSFEARLGPIALPCLHAIPDLREGRMLAPGSARRRHVFLHLRRMLGLLFVVRDEGGRFVVEEMREALLAPPEDVFDRHTLSDHLATHGLFTILRPLAIAIGATHPLGVGCVAFDADALAERLSSLVETHLNPRLDDPVLCRSGALASVPLHCASGLALPAFEDLACAILRAHMREDAACARVVFDAATDHAGASVREVMGVSDVGCRLLQRLVCAHGLTGSRLSPGDHPVLRASRIGRLPSTIVLIETAPSALARAEACSRLASEGLRLISCRADHIAIRKGALRGRRATPSLRGSRAAI